jgi:hypothetical protein
VGGPPAQYETAVRAAFPDEENRGCLEDLVGLTQVSNLGLQALALLTFLACGPIGLVDLNL